MIAIEIEAPIVNHRMVIASKKLPANAGRAKVIVMFEAEAAVPAANGSIEQVALADFRLHPVVVSEPLTLLTRDEANAR